jgi:hypothetical protein
LHLAQACLVHGSAGECLFISALKKFSPYPCISPIHQRFDVPAEFKQSLETFQYHIPIFQKHKCAKIHGHLDYIKSEREKKGIVHATTKARIQKFGSCLKSAHTLGMPSGTGLLVQEKHANWIIGGTDYGDWARLSNTCEAHTHFNSPRPRPTSTLPKSPFLVYTKGAVVLREGSTHSKASGFREHFQPPRGCYHYSFLEDHMCSPTNHNYMRSKDYPTVEKVGMLQ